MMKFNRTIFKRFLNISTGALCVAFAHDAFAQNPNDTFNDVELPAGFEVQQIDAQAAGQALNPTNQGPTPRVMNANQAAGMQEVMVGNEGSTQKVDETVVEEQQAKDEFEKLWQSSVQNELGETDITNEVNVRDIVEPSTEYRYASFGKRDPFVPPIGKFEFYNKTEEGSRYEIPVVNGLQRPLDSMTLSGVWQNENGEFRALVSVRDFGGLVEGVIAKVGDPFGPAGKITEISDYRLVTRQYKIEKDGTRTFDDRSLYLGDPADRFRDSKRTFILGPNGRTLYKIESDIAGVLGRTRYFDAETGANVTNEVLRDQEEAIRNRVNDR